MQYFLAPVESLVFTSSLDRMTSTSPTPNLDGGYLPMPVTRARRIEAERREYQERQRLHYQAFPEYARGWHRPTPETASRICYDLLGLPLIEAPRGGGTTDSERVAYRIATEQAVVIALDAVICAGEAGRMATTNLVLIDAVSRYFSDWYRRIT